MFEELDAVAAQDVDGAEDVAGGERDVLAAGAVVELEVLVDLRLLLRDRRLVERELHPVVAAGDHLAHEGGVLGGDVVADELGHVREAEHLVVEGDPLVHPAELDVADAVVDGLEQPLRVTLAAGDGGAARLVAGQVGAGVAAAVDQRVAGLAVGGDGGGAHGAVLVGDVVRLDQDRRAHRAGVVDALVDVGHLEGEVDDAVAVLAVVVEHRAVGRDAAGEHEPGAAGAQHVGLRAALAGLGAAVRLEVHAQRELVEGRGLGGVADHEAHGVHRGDRERVAGGVVLDEAHELLELLEGEVGLELVRGQRHAAVMLPLDSATCATVRRHVAQSAQSEPPPWTTWTAP